MKKNNKIIREYVISKYANQQLIESTNRAISLYKLV